MTDTEIDRIIEDAKRANKALHIKDTKIFQAPSFERGLQYLNTESKIAGRNY